MKIDEHMKDIRTHCIVLEDKYPGVEVMVSNLSRGELPVFDCSMDSVSVVTSKDEGYETVASSPRVIVPLSMYYPCDDLPGKLRVKAERLIRECSPKLVIVVIRDAGPTEDTLFDCGVAAFNCTIPVEVNP